MTHRLYILLAVVVLLLAQIACSDNGISVQPVNVHLRAQAACPAGDCE